MEKILPEVGSSGVFNVLPPFDQFVIEQVQYTCTSIRSISELQTYTRSVLEEYYLVYGLTVEDYQRDLENNELIISLRNGAEFVYVPSRYLISYPDVSGIPYHVVSLAVTLGAIPVGSDLSVLKEKVGELVLNNTGLTPDIEEVEISATRYIEQSEHEAVLARRNYLTTDNETFYLKYQKKLSEYEQALLKVNALEAFISSTYAIGSVSSTCDAINQLRVRRDRESNTVIIENESGVRVVLTNEGNVIYYLNNEEIYRYQDSTLDVKLGDHHFNLINGQLVNDYMSITNEGNRFYNNSAKIQTVTDITGTGEIHNEFMDVSVVNGVLNASIDGVSINANSQVTTITNSKYNATINDNAINISVSEQQNVVITNGTVSVYSNGILVYSGDDTITPTAAPTEPPTAAPTEPPTLAPGSVNVEEVYYQKCCIADITSAEGLYLSKDTIEKSSYFVSVD